MDPEEFLYYNVHLAYHSVAFDLFEVPACTLYILKSCPYEVILYNCTMYVVCVECRSILLKSMLHISGVLGLSDCTFYKINLGSVHFHPKSKLFCTKMKPDFLQ